MKKWEYIREYCEYSGEVYVKWLREKGQQGWEYCQSSDHVYGSNTIFKREIEVGSKYSQVQRDEQVQDAKRILIELQVPEMFLNKMCCLTFLALCNIAPDQRWNTATNEHMGLTKDIMEFIADNYNMQYKSGTRESFRRDGINVLIRFNIIDINPGDPNLGPNSPKVHYAIKESVLEKIRKSDKESQ